MSRQMREPETRDPGRFLWVESGNSFVARFGRLSIAVSKKGRRGIDQRWRVTDIFGAKHLGGGWAPSLDDAILEAEALAIREAGLLPDSMKDQPRRIRRELRKEAARG